MMTSVVLTVIGPDKPGLVELLAKTINDHQGSWLESDMSRLAGKFAGIMIAALPSQQYDALVTQLNSLERQGLKITAERSDIQPDSSSAKQHLSIEVMGHDKPGIMREISSALAQRKINVERLSTELFSGSMSAEQLFKAEVQLTATNNIDLDELQTALEAIADDLMIDINLDT